MNIFLYWNRNDRDSKKIYKFLEDKDFRDTVEQSHSLIVKDPYVFFELTEDIQHQIAQSDLVLFFTHGEEDAILKCLYIHPSMKKRFTFIDSDNASMLSNKRVIAICCSSAKELGKLCVDEPIHSKFYVGFQEPITYDDGAHERVRGLIYTSYSDAFKEALLYALTTNCTAQEFVLKLQKSISDMLIEKILSETDNRVLGSLATVRFHHASAASLVALGDATLPVFA